MFSLRNHCKITVWVSRNFHSFLRNTLGLTEILRKVEIAFQTELGHALVG